METDQLVSYFKRLEIYSLIGDLIVIKKLQNEWVHEYNISLTEE